MNWFHRLLNPHCEVCKDLEDKNNINSPLEILKQQLAIANDEKRKLLEVVIELQKPKEVIQEAVNTEELRPIKTAPMPWGLKRSLLEREHRKVEDKGGKEVLKNKIEDLEKEVLG